MFSWIQMSEKVLNKFYFYATTLLTYSEVGCTSQTAYRSRWTLHLHPAAFVLVSSCLCDSICKNKTDRDRNIAWIWIKINDEIRIEFTDLPKALKNTIKELEEYDRNNDTMFYECADMLYMMADRFLKDGAIDSETRDKLIMKYPIA